MRLRTLLILPVLVSCNGAHAQTPTAPPTNPSDDPLTPPVPVGVTVLGNVKGVWVFDDARRRITCYAHVNGGIACVR